MIAPVPAAYFHVPFGENDNMHFGASLTVPFGFKTEYDRDWVGRYNGVKTELQAIDPAWRSPMTSTRTCRSVLRCSLSA